MFLQFEQNCWLYVRDNNDLCLSVMPEFNEVFTPELQTVDFMWSLSKQPTSDE